jgi:hypothetical protein
MSITEKIPVNPNAVRVRYPVQRFSAPLIAGQYDFGIAANTDILLLPLQSNSVYLIERISFFAQATESDWLESMGTAAQFPAFRLHYQFDDANSLYPEPVRCVNYVDNAEQLVFFRTTRDSENLLISFSGIVTQVAGMVGLNPLLAQVNFTIYQVTDENWNRKFINPDEFGR